MTALMLLLASLMTACSLVAGLIFLNPATAVLTSLGAVVLAIGSLLPVLDRRAILTTRHIRG